MTPSTAAPTDAGALADLPTIPDDDSDFTPDLARKIIAKYQELLRNSAPQETRGGWPPPFEPMKLQARKPDGGEWTDIFPAQLQAMVRNGCDVRAIESQQETRGDEPVADPMRDLALMWGCRANALRILNSHREEPDAASDQAIETYEECADELRKALAASQQSPRLEREGLEVAFKPFADFMSATLFDKLSDETRLTAGSPMARRQLTVADLRKLSDAILALLSPDTTVVSSTSRGGASDAPEEISGAEMDAIEAAAIAGNPLTTNDYELAGWARQWHWNDCADDRPVDPSIYFRDMRMLKAFIEKCQLVPSNHPREVGK